jgi:hypothetical protein
MNILSQCNFVCAGQLLFWSALMHGAFRVGAVCFIYLYCRMTSANWKNMQTGLLQVHVEKTKAVVEKTKAVVEKTKAVAASESISERAHSLPVLMVPGCEPMMPFSMDISTKMLSKSRDIDKAFFNQVLNEMRAVTSVIQIVRKGYVRTLNNQSCCSTLTCALH